MADHATLDRTPSGVVPVASNRASSADPALEAGFRRFRDELDARLVARFGASFADRDGSDADPEILADLALQRALGGY